MGRIKIMGQLTNQFLVNFIVVACSLLLPVTVKAETVLEEIERTGVFRVGIRSDAVPFGYRKPNGQLTGYCVDFIASLKEKISDTIERDELLVRIFESTASNRWRLVSERTVHIECGPNTIREEMPEESISFSQPFFVTGTQFLVLNSERDAPFGSRRSHRVALNSTLEGVRIAVLRGTTTESLVEDRYPQATVVKLQGSTGRLRGVQGVLQGRFDTFVSDGILLLGEAEALRARDYQLIPDQPLSCDQYGMILPEEDMQWETLVNSILVSQQGRQIWQNWFEVVLPQIEKTRQACD